MVACIEYYGINFGNLQVISRDIKAAKAAETVAGDISRRKKVKEKRPSPFLFAG
jgi:hypothetical protein